MNPEDKFKALKAKTGGSKAVPSTADSQPKTTTPPSSQKPPAQSSKETTELKNVPFSDGKESLISRSFKETLDVDIRNRKEQFFKGTAKTVSSLNDTGEFDVLPKHANFVTLIRGYVIVDKGLETERKFDIENGVLAAKTGEVDVYLDF